jgi:hypothetical protein
MVSLTLCRDKSNLVATVRHEFAQLRWKARSNRPVYTIKEDLAIYFAKSSHSFLGSFVNHDKIWNRGRDDQHLTSIDGIGRSFMTAMVDCPSVTCRMPNEPVYMDGSTFEDGSWCTLYGFMHDLGAWMGRFATRPSYGNPYYSDELGLKQLRLFQKRISLARQKKMTIPDAELLFDDLMSVVFTLQVLKTAQNVGGSQLHGVQHLMVYYLHYARQIQQKLPKLPSKAANQSRTGSSAIPQTRDERRADVFWFVALLLRSFWHRPFELHAKRENIEVSCFCLSMALLQPLTCVDREYNVF